MHVRTAVACPHLVCKAGVGHGDQQSQFAWNSPSFSTESPVSQETPQSQANPVLSPAGETELDSVMSLQGATTSGHWAEQEALPELGNREVQSSTLQKRSENGACRSSARGAGKGSPP